MMELRNWMIWPDDPLLSGLVLIAIAMLALYAARMPMHGLIRSAGLALSGPLRLGARWLFGVALDMKMRNKAVLLAQGRREAGQRIEREFERIGMLVTRDLQGYPTLQRRLLEEITRVEEDYKKCGEVPPPPPDWIDAVAAVAKIKTGGGEVVQKILDDIRTSIAGIHDKALAEYRRAYQARHSILEGFMPHWRSLDKTMKQVEKSMAGLQASASTVDAHMDAYKEIAAASDKAESVLTHSAFTQFVSALLVMAVALGGAFVNFKLIALPMSEMVGASDYLTSSLRTSEVAALVIILVEASMGLFLMESLRITHLFPRIANLEDRMRRRMVWISLALLVTLGCVEAALALMRDTLIADKQALLQSLATVPAAVNEGLLGRIPTAGQMILGFILPLALAFVAVPLESFIHSARAVGGALLVNLVRSAAFLLRLLGNIARQGSRALLHAYDVLIVLPLLAERVLRSARGRESVPAQRAVDAPEKIATTF
ncbi:MAG TPA: hypothetical protein VKP89_00755 [Burkholderiales bacterium]|nr:hypothetical protein [Burkholderiales bacterium]